jgi:DNA repair protein RadA/Sms
MSKEKVVWECQNCGNQQYKWTGSCSACNEWNTFVEQVVFQDKKRKADLVSLKKASAVPVNQVSISSFHRQKTNLQEIDRLLGGGVVNGSLILIGGEPGIGKSTLLLQISSQFANQNLKVLYICGEESAEQTAMRAQRLKVNSENLYLLNETLVDAVIQQIETIKPQVIIVDSVQILYKGEIPSAPGSVVQVREVALEFMKIAKGMGITVFLIGHVTKTGDLAGPRVLEHLVDTVLSFEGEHQHGFRMLRSQKNRFGPTDDIALFQMKETGLFEIPNPSAVFLEERQKQVAGTVIVPTVEGIRSILIEIQALATTSVFPTPARKCTGFDYNRLSLLLAVLEKRLGYRLYQYDVFVSIAGGMKIVEPACDLGVALAIASSFLNRTLDGDTVVIGEVGLTGEVRRVGRVENRIKEAHQMGFLRCVLPRKNLQEVAQSWGKKIELIGVDLVDEAIRCVL